MSSLLLNWITILFLSKKYDLELKTKIKDTNKNIISSRKYLSIRSIIRNNFDIKPAILKLFYASYWINILFFVLSSIANFFYVQLYIYRFFDLKLNGIDNDIIWPWIGILIINILFVFFLIRFINDYYKLSLRGNFRNSYLKLLFLDIFTLNIFSIIGTLVFIKTKKQMLNITRDYQINHSNFNFQSFRDYSKLIFKVEILILVLTLIVFLIALITGFFVKSNIIKFICWIITAWSMVFLFCWSIPRITGMIIIQKMFKNLLNNDYSYYYLLTTIRFLVFSFGTYHLAMLINFLKIDQSSKEFILENW